MTRAALRLAPAALAILAVLAWMSIASTLFVWLGGLTLYFPRPWLGAVWLRYVAWHATNTHWTNALLVLSAVPMTALYGLVGAAAWRPMARRARLRWRARTGLAPKERGPTDNHGHADWLSMPELRRRFPGPHPNYGGIVVGEAYRVDQDSVAAIPFDSDMPGTWGKGGKAPLLIDPCTEGSGHSLVFGGPGSGKSMSAVSTMLHWTGSAVVLDPSCEMGPLLAAARRGMGHKVHLLSADTARTGFNVLDWIDISDPLAEVHINSVVLWVCGDMKPGLSKEADFFARRGRQLVTCLLADMLWSNGVPSGRKTLKTLRAAISQPRPG